MSWIAPKITRIDEPFAAGERAMLEGFLEWQRATPVWKCAGPSGEQLSERSVPPSTLSLLGLVRHHGDVERTWFRRRFRGEQLPSLFWRADRPDAAFEARRAHVAAYAAGGALTAGFSWYRAFPRDAADNRRASEGPHVTTPLLDLRGAQERGGDISAYAAGLRDAGVTPVEQGIVSGAGHFTQEEAPEETWRPIASFAQP